MHRSGTSLLAKYVSELGYSIGLKAMSPSYDNPQGFYENEAIVDLNNALLSKCRSKWDLPVLSTTQLERPVIHDFFTEQIKEILDVEFSRDSKILIKDPRICLLLPLYLPFFKTNTNYNLKIVWIIRHPESVAQSLFKRDKFNRYKSQFLYARYNLDVQQALNSKEYLQTIYEDILKNPAKAGDEIKHFLSLEHVESPALQDMVFTPTNNQLENPRETTEQEVAGRLYNILTSNKGSNEGNEELGKLLDDINKETRIVDSWTQRKYHSKLIQVGANSEKKELSSFIANNGWNVIQWNNSDDKSLKILEFVPFNRVGSYQFTDVNINGEIARWETVGMIEKGNKYQSSSQYAKLIIKSEVSISSIYIRYFAETFDLDEVDFQELLDEKSELEKLKADFNMLLHKTNEEKKNLENLLEGKANDYRHLYENATDRQNDLLQYQQNLQSIVEDYHKKLESHKIGFERIEDVDSNVKLLIDKVIEEKATNLRMKERIRQEVDNSVMALSKELGELKNKMDESSDRTKELEEAKSKIQTLEKEKEDFSTTKQVLLREKEEVLSIVDRQHKEILNFKKAYNDRERELSDTSSSLSYKLGRIVTWPARMVYEFGKFSAAFLSFLATGIFVVLGNPGKAFSLFRWSNFVILFKAIRSEPYIHILYNLKKRLGVKNNNIKGHESQKIISNVSSIRRKKILYISPNLPNYDQSSGGRRATKMLALMSNFADITAFTLGSRPRKYQDYLRDIGVHVINSSNPNDVFREFPDIDVIIFAWFYTLHDNSAIFKNYPSALKIVDTVDVHWVREERSIGQIEGVTKESVQMNKEVEIAAYRHADIVWAVTENDKLAITRELSDAYVSVVSNIHDVSERSYHRTEKKNLLFFGGYNHPPNIAAVDILINDIRPKVLASIQDAKFIIAGANAPERVKKYENFDNVEFLGFIPEEEMDLLYEKSYLVVVPLTAGAGIKGKICEAISYGVPILTTEIGNEGINLIDGKEGFIAEVDEMADKVISILTSDIDMKAIVESSKAKLSSIVGPDRARSQMFQDMHPMVTICIVTWNRLDLLEKCLDSIFANTVYPFYRVVVHSNGCSDGTQAYLREKAEGEKRLVPRLSTTNDVFVRPNNAMMIEYNDSDALLLNNDTEVTEGWLLALRKAAYSNEKIGIAGSKLLYPDGVLQEFGSELYTDGSGRNIGKGEDPTLAQYNVLKRVGYVSGCSMYIKRSTIDRIGVFDDQFHPCYCEDSDYAYTAWEQGLETVVTPDSVVVHHEGGTSGTDENSGFKSYQKENFTKFLSKHENSLEQIGSYIKEINERPS